MFAWFFLLAIAAFLRFNCCDVMCFRCMHGEKEKRLCYWDGTGEEKDHGYIKNPDLWIFWPYAYFAEPLMPNHRSWINYFLCIVSTCCLFCLLSISFLGLTVWMCVFYCLKSVVIWQSPNDWNSLMCIFDTHFKENTLNFTIFC